MKQTITAGPNDEITIDDINTKVLTTFSSYRMIAYFRFQMPLFATIYLFIVFLFDFFFSQDLVNKQEYIYYMTGVWVIVMMQAGKILPTILVSSISFLIGSLISGSVFGGYVGITVILALVFAYSFEDNFMFKLINNHLKIKTHKSLGGKELGKLRLFFSRANYIYLIITPLFMLYTLYKIFSNLQVSKSHLSLKYLDSPVESLFIALPLIIVFMNISITAFGGIFNFLQEDFFKALGERILFKRKNPNEFMKQEEEMEELYKKHTGKARLPIAPNDRSLPLNLTTIHKFRIALSFFCVDALLTMTSVLGITILPGISLDNIFTLSSILKIPIYIIFIIKSVNRLQGWLSIKANIGLDSETFRKEIKSEFTYYSDIEKLLRDIQRQQISNTNYIDVAENRYLLWLGGHPYFEKRSHF